MAKQPKPEQTPEPAPEPTLEHSLDELERVVRQLESADLPLDKSLELFERGMELSARCRRQLTAAETRVEMLIKKGEETEAVPFDAGEEL
jgi:exodeoxyribonuclease VII small subunit